jgi:hypothetical protein
LAARGARAAASNGGHRHVSSMTQPILSIMFIMSCIPAP